jgi:RsiW-degrading membrane proteinase PrsW (M82 family)
VTLWIALAAAVVAVVLLVYRYDLYEREPWWMLGLMVAAGVAAMGAIGTVEDRTLDWLSSAPEPAAVLVSAVAAVEEELVRLALVLGLAVLAPRQFNDPIDGLVYGSMVGIGMAAEESVQALTRVPDLGALLPPSELVRLAGHCIMGGITGFGVGMLRLRMRGAVAAIAGCFAASTGLHLAWDWLAEEAARAGTTSPEQAGAAVALMLAGMMLYGTLVVVGSGWSRRVFAPGSARRLGGWPFASRPPRDRQV